MKKTKRFYSIIGIVLVAAIGGLIFLLTRGSDPQPGTTTTSKAPNGVDTQAYLALVKTEGELQTPLLESDIENIFYTVSTGGKVAFYKYEDGAMNKVEATGSYDLSVTCSNQKIPATVYYYKQGDTVSGYGLFTTEISDADVQYYDYAFFKLMNLPETFAKSNTYLLLVDTNKENFFLNDKIYEEPFQFNASSKETKKLLYDANRGIDERGAYRKGYHMITTDAVKDAGKYLFFFSSRHYHLDANQTDIFRSGEAGYNNKDNQRRALDVADYYCRATEDGNGFYFLKNTENGFALMLNKKDNSEDYETVKTFSGSYKNDYLRAGKYLLEKATYKLTDLETLAETTLAFEGSEEFKPDLFSVNEKSGKVLLRGISKNFAAIAIADKAGAAGELYYNESFLYIVDPTALADGSFLVSIAKDANNSGYKYVIFA
ncbi:MAG: hypothetical protein LBS36_11680 [Oscillospiraceae bacterium]|nr:hypothetical protein [Oscillospiraceae bacterium]